MEPRLTIVRERSSLNVQVDSAVGVLSYSIVHIQFGCGSVNTYFLRQETERRKQETPLVHKSNRSKLLSYPFARANHNQAGLQNHKGNVVPASELVGTDQGYFQTLWGSLARSTLASRFFGSSTTRTSRSPSYPEVAEVFQLGARVIAYVRFVAGRRCLESLWHRHSEELPGKRSCHPNLQELCRN